MGAEGDDVNELLYVVPLELSEANLLVAQWHRHHVPVLRHRFSLGAVSGGRMVGAAICGGPASPNTDRHKTLEVSRLVTDGTPNACSLLYGACARAAKAMGYERIQTFILDTETGVTLRASGWTNDGLVKTRPWSHRPNRRDNLQNKIRWVRELNDPRPEFDRPKAASAQEALAI